MMWAATVEPVQHLPQPRQQMVASAIASSPVQPRNRRRQGCCRLLVEGMAMIADQLSWKRPPECPPFGASHLLNQLLRSRSHYQCGALRPLNQLLRSYSHHSRLRAHAVIIGCHACGGRAPLPSTAAAPPLMWRTGPARTNRTVHSTQLCMYDRLPTAARCLTRLQLYCPAIGLGRADASAAVEKCNAKLKTPVPQSRVESPLLRSVNTSRAWRVVLGRSPTHTPSDGPRHGT